MSILERLATIHLVFLDTAPVIYFIEKNPSYTSIVNPIFDRLDEGGILAVVSPITLAECLVLPHKLNNPGLAQLFTDLLVQSQNILFCPVDETTADKAANLRARYNLTLTDAFQIATAIQTGCDAFLTNDTDLKRVTDIPVLVLSE